MKVFLLGFMGSGKSYIGQKLATSLDFKFIDLDDKIAEMAGKGIPEIFKSEGQPAFRNWEQKALHDLKNCKNAIIALGGGTPCFFDNMDWIDENGISIYIKCSPDILIERLKNETERRPLIAGKNEKELADFIQFKLMERAKFYEQAQLVYFIEKENTKVIDELKGFFKRFDLA